MSTLSHAPGDATDATPTYSEAADWLYRQLAHVRQLRPDLADGFALATVMLGHHDGAHDIWDAAEKRVQYRDKLKRDTGDPRAIAIDWMLDETRSWIDWPA